MESRTVLFVDDDNGILNALKRVLRSEPYECLLADSGNKALEILEKERVDVIVTDLEMPEMDGFTLLAEVRKKYPDIIRLILSGRADTISILDSINNGNVYRYILKPWNGMEVKTTIRQAISLFNLQKERRNLLKERDDLPLERRTEKGTTQILSIQDKAKIGEYASEIVKTMKTHLDHIESSLSDLKKIIDGIPI